MNPAKIVVIVFAVIIVALFTVYIFVPAPSRDPAGPINSFTDCVGAGYPVMESYPRQCRTPDGTSFTEDIGNELEKTNLIRITTPRPNEIIKNPLVIEGEARGYWYFEASFPVELLDGNGNKIELTPGYIMATDDWMTEEFVPFKATLQFQVPATDNGTLILRKDNPSGLPEYDDELRVPVRFR